MKLNEQVIKEAFSAAGCGHAAPKAITIVKKKTITTSPKPKSDKEDAPAKKAQHTDYVTSDERAESIKMGMFLRCAAEGGHPDQADGILKQSALGDIPDAGAKFVLMGSLATGIPIGIMAHLIHQRVKATDRKERLLDAKIQHYRNAGQDIESGLAGAGAVI